MTTLFQTKQAAFFYSNRSSIRRSDVLVGNCRLHRSMTASRSLLDALLDAIMLDTFVFEREQWIMAMATPAKCGNLAGLDYELAEAMLIELRSIARDFPFSPRYSFGFRAQTTRLVGEEAKPVSSSRRNVHSIRRKIAEPASRHAILMACNHPTSRVCVFRFNVLLAISTQKAVMAVFYTG